MARIIKTIEIEGQQALVLFDTGPVLTYVMEHLLTSALRKPAVEPFRVALGGEEHRGSRPLPYRRQDRRASL